MSFRYYKVKYLGHIIYKAGVEVDPEIIALRSFQEPTKQKEIRSCLGLCIIYEKKFQNHNSNNNIATQRH